MLSPIPRQFDWMNREVRPNPFLQALLDLRGTPSRLLFSAFLTEDYSDNFFLEERNRQDGYRTRVGIGTVYRLESARSFVSLANTIDAAYELRSKESEIGFANLALNIGHQLPRLSLALSESFIRSDDVEAASPSGFRSERRTFLLNRLSPQLRYEVTRLTAFDLAYIHTLVLNEEQGQDSDNGRDSSDTTSHAFIAELESRLSRNLLGSIEYGFTTSFSDEANNAQTHRAEGTLAHSLDARTSVLLGTSGTIINRSDGDSDSQHYGMRVGVNRQLTSFLGVFGSIGAIFLDREDRPQRIFPSWQVSLSGALPITRRTNLTFDSRQTVASTEDEADNVGLVLRQRVGLTLSHALSRNIRGSLFVNYTRSEDLEDIGTAESVEGRLDTFWRGGARISYALTQIFSLSAGYIYTNHDSNSIGRDYTENRITLTLSADFVVF
jgi:hypothetical protein